MLLIRPGQYDALSEVALESFDERMAAHFTRYFPFPTKSLGHKATLGIVRAGRERASEHGVVTQRGICLYLSLTYMLGARFDEDPYLPWARGMLTDEQVADPDERVELLYDRVERFLDEVDGENDEHLVRAFARVRSQPYPSIRTPVENDESAIVEVITRLHPTRAAAAGDEALHRGVRYHAQAADRIGLAGVNAHGLLATIGFFLGSGFADDLKLPWAGLILADRSESDPEARARRLHARCLEHLDQATAQTTEGGE